MKPPLNPSSRGRTVALCLLLFVLVAWVFLPSLCNDFVTYDDNLYVTENRAVQGGLTRANLNWAFQTTTAANWHPLTWISHMADCQLYDLKPLGHHLTSLLLHAANAVLVFLLFHRMTGATWRSLVLAALFGLHPLRVESVAWVAERKDVLSLFFGLLALIFYARYVLKTESRKQKAETSGRFLFSILCPLTSGSYWLSLLFLALGLMSKPMLVTWPFVLVLLDYWPLQRLRPAIFTRRSNLARLLVEKLPFFILAAASSVITLHVQQSGGAVKASLPMLLRSDNALISCCRYLGKLIWPVALSPFYPHPVHWSRLAVLGCGVVVVTITSLAVGQRQRRPHLLVGWLWFLGTLVPVIGLVQVGVQAMADRYTYVPTIGILIFFVWGTHELTRCWRFQAVTLSVAAGLLALGCLGLTRQQIGYWKDSETLFRHSIAVTKSNHVMHYNLGLLLFRKGQIDAAIAHFRRAVEIRPSYVDAHINLAIALLRTGKADEGTAHLQEAVRLAPRDAEAHYDLAISLTTQGRLDEAIAQLQEALKLNPGFAYAHERLSRALVKKGQVDEAMAHFHQAVQINSNLANAHSDLGNLLLEKAQVEEAIAHYQRALEIQPANAYFLNNLAWVLATCPKPEVRNGPRAIELAQQAERLSGGNNPAILGTLAAAYAEDGRFPEALATARRAFDLASAQTNAAYAGVLRANIALYQTGSPLHEASQINLTLDLNAPSPNPAHTPVEHNAP